MTKPKGREIDWNDVALFTEVVGAGSFTAASRALGLPKSSVSRGVARLESALSVRLLQRTTRSLSLTDGGQSFYDRVRGAMDGLEEAADSVRELGAEPRGLVRLTAATDSHLMGLAEAIAAFVRTYPLIQVELILTGRIVDLVGEGVDLAIRAGKLVDSSLIVRKIGSDDLRLFASSSYLERKGRPRKLADLKRHDCVLFHGRGGRTHWTLTGPNGDETIEVTGAISADDLAFIAPAMMAGAGIGLLPALLAGQYAKRGALEPVLADYRVTGGTLSVVLPSSRLVPQRVSLLRDFLVAELSKRIAEMTRVCSKRGSGRHPRTGE